MAKRKKAKPLPAGRYEARVNRVRFRRVGDGLVCSVEIGDLKKVRRKRHGNERKTKA